MQTGLHSNENMLVCAPTGAGKTNIAMIAVLREVGLHRREGVLARDEFKIVYVAPMKALAAEVTRTFGSRLEAIGIQVRARPHPPLPRGGRVCDSVSWLGRAVRAQQIGRISQGLMTTPRAVSSRIHWRANSPHQREL